MALCLRTERRGARYLDAVSEGENGGGEGRACGMLYTNARVARTSLVVCWRSRLGRGMIL